jgi:hypothetical protein
MPFRQQVRMQPWAGVTDNAYYYGNNIVQLQESATNQLKLADILAASSCFPGGFEPLEMPHDFCYDNLTPDILKKSISYAPLTNSPKEKEFIANGNLGLMDGGITDNQGLESAMHADRSRRAHAGAAPNFKPFDLIIVNDVSSFYMTPYTVPKTDKIPVAMLTMRNYRNLLSVLLAAGLTLFIHAFYFQNIWTAMLGGVFTVLSFVIVAAMTVVNRNLTSKNNRSAINLEHTFTQPVAEKLANFLRRTPTGLLKEIMKARFNSVMILTNDVFMARIRFILYNEFFNNAMWANRRLGNNIYDVSFSNDITRNGPFYAGYPVPGKLMQTVAESAAAMGTTLWFEPGTSSMAGIIATGQFSVCYNLSGYISKLKSEPIWNDLSAAQQASVNDVEQQLRADWAAFTTDPLFLYNKMGAELLGADFKPVAATSITLPQ